MDFYGKSNMFQHNRSNSIKILPIQAILLTRAEILTLNLTSLVPHTPHFKEICVEMCRSLF